MNMNMNMNMMNAAAKIGPRIQFHTLSANLLPQPKKSQPYPFVPSILNPPRKTLKISCHKGKEKEQNLADDEMLAVELGLEIKKYNSNMVQREEALEKSREILFTEICNFMGLKSEDMKKKWRRMNEDERWITAKGFAAEWSGHFHPLSARSVKEMVEEYLGKNNELLDDPHPPAPGSSKLLPDLMKLLGFSENNEE